MPWIKSQDSRVGITHLCLDALFLACAMLFSYVEHLFPIASFVALPGIKLGLCNIIITICAIYLPGPDAAIVCFVRVLLSFLLFGNTSTFIFSLSGAVCSLLILFTLRRYVFRTISALALSVLSAVFHAIGQLLACAILFRPTTALAYAPVLIFAAIPTGVLTGLLCTLLFRRIPLLKQPE